MQLIVRVITPQQEATTVNELIECTRSTQLIDLLLELSFLTCGKWAVIQDIRLIVVVKKDLSPIFHQIIFVDVSKNICPAIALQLRHDGIFKVTFLRENHAHCHPSIPTTLTVPVVTNTGLHQATPVRPRAHPHIHPMCSTIPQKRR